MRFTKMHGIGNDYVYVDCFDEPFPTDPGGLARRMADRHFGVGGDGVIFICPSQIADARMRMFNADGSEAQMCGNGIRCVAKYLYDHEISPRQQLAIETGAGILRLDLELADGNVERVRVNMGCPILEAGRIPIELPRGKNTDRVVEYPIGDILRQFGPPGWMEDSGLDPRMTSVSMGNPHAVLYCEHVERIPLENVGPAIERQAIFPERVNVHFVEVRSSSEVTMRTWERGSGITLACGTGATAVCVAGVLTGRTARSLLAHLPGGDLELEWAGDDHVYMTGPAVEVFSGDWQETSAALAGL